MIADWVVSRNPHLVFIELTINDGDSLLETNDVEASSSLTRLAWRDANQSHRAVARCGNSMRCADEVVFVGFSCHMCRESALRWKASCDMCVTRCPSAR